MVKSQYVSLQDASLLSNKSAQTIRRMIKANKIRYRKYKTPQGFTYLVEKTSLMNHFDVESAEEMGDNEDSVLEDEVVDESINESGVAEFEMVEEVNPPERAPQQDKGVYSVRIDHPPTLSMGSQTGSQPAGGFLGSQTGGAVPASNGQNPHTSAPFQNVVSQLVQQHREDKKRLFELLEIFQKRIHVLEDQIRQLEAPKTVKSPWYKRLFS